MLLSSDNEFSVNACDTIFEFNNSELTVKPSGITNDMLAGSIANNKLANASVSFGNVTLELGESDATPAFDLQDVLLAIMLVL